MTNTREKIDYNMHDIYAYYRKTRQNKENYAKFSKILKTFNKKLVEHAHNADYLTLPYKLGDIYVKKYKPTYKFKEDGSIDTFGQPGIVDFKATKELWEKYPELKHKQRVLYDNSHTDGFKFKIHWRRGNVKNVTIYNFRPARYFKRGLAEYLRRNPNQEYYDN